MWLESKQLGINPLKLEVRINILKCFCRRKQLILEVLRYVQYETNSDNLLYVSANPKSHIVFVTIAFSENLPLVTWNIEKSHRSEQKDCFHSAPCDVTIKGGHFPMGEELSHQRGWPGKAPLFPPPTGLHPLSSAILSIPLHTVWLLVNLPRGNCRDDIVVLMN